MKHLHENHISASLTYFLPVPVSSHLDKNAQDVIITKLKCSPKVT